MDQNAAEGELARFFSSLTDATRAADAELHQRLGAFFSGLKPAMAVAQAAQAELDRQLAAKWSVFPDFFHFIYKKENALSRIFCTLLDPAGTHGQGARFLDALLDEIRYHHRELLGERPHPPGTEEQKAPWPLAHSGCTAHTEYRTDDGGSIDIVIQWPDSRTYWIGIENKPWAAEQERQIERYFNALRRKTDISRVLVLYFSGTGADPETAPEDGKERCVTLPYRTTPDRPSVEGWVRRCRAVCEAERFRWFLAEIERYIQRSFEPKEVPMALSNKTIIRFVQENRKFAELAEAVAEAVPPRKKRIKELAHQEVNNLLLQEFPHSPDSASDWWLREDGRLYLHRNEKKHPCWKPDRNHGLWYVWGWGYDAPCVGVEWPFSAGNLHDLGELFPDKGAGVDRKRIEEAKKEFFVGCSLEKDWIGWNHLLAKRDDEIQTMAKKTVELMKALAKDIDDRCPATG